VRWCWLAPPSTPNRPASTVTSRGGWWCGLLNLLRALGLGKWFGVYDGHCGVACAEYLQQHLHKEVLQAYAAQGR
jgi:hypothetical protein